MGGNMNTCAIDVELWQWVVRERGYHIHEAIWEASQREIVPVLICLLWLLPSVVNERGISPVFCSCLRLLHFAVYFVNQHSLS